MEFKLDFTGFVGLVAEGELIHFFRMDVQLDITFSFVGANIIVGEDDLFSE